MTLTDLVAPAAVVPALKVNNKKQAIQELAARAAVLTGQSERAILEILLQREKLGSTAVGNGVAIPHGKLPKLGRLFGLFARLERAIDFEALDGQPVDLTRKEFDLLTLLIGHAGAVVTRERLIDEVWDVNWFGSTKTLDVHVSGLRKKLGDDAAQPRYLHTVRGVGFRFAAQVEADAR